MKYLLVVLLVVASSLTDLDRIATINKLKKEAKEAYNHGDYKTALNKYIYLTDSMNVEDDNVRLNMANAYYQLKDSANALNTYHELVDSKDNVVRSVAQQQLGVMADRGKKFKEALEHFKEAIKADPSNEDARYNYELLKKVLDEQQKQQQQNQDKQNQKDQQQKDKEQQQKQDQKNQQNQQNEQNKDQENKDQQQDQNKEGEGKEQQDKDQQKKGKEDQKEGKEKKDEQKKEPQEGEESDQKNKNKQDQMGSLSDKLQEMKISEEKARMIMDALKNKEIQYYQQMKKKPTKRRDSGKPDW